MDAYRLGVYVRRMRQDHSKKLEKREPRSFWKNVGAVIMTIVALSGISAIALWPRVTVEPGGQIDPTQASPIYFTIANGGLIPLWNVKPRLGICEIQVGEPTDLVDRCEKGILSALVPTSWFASSLAMDEKQTLRLDDAIKIAAPMKFGGANISIGVEYQPWFIPIRRNKEFRFSTKLERDGKMSWVQRPLNK
jgi:hypothetical protein